MSAPKKMDQVFAQLLSADDKLVLEALATVESQGNAKAIRPMLHSLAATKDHAVQQRIMALLFEVKVSDAVPELIGALDEPALRGVRKTILATFWNAGLDVQEHLGTLVSCAIEGDAEECFECLTVIEHQELWPEKAVRTAILRLKNAAESEADPYKGVMLKDLRSVLEERIGK